MTELTKYQILLEKEDRLANLEHAALMLKDLEKLDEQNFRQQPVDAYKFESGEVRDNIEQTAPHFTVAGGHKAVEELPVGQGVDKETKDSKGRTTPHFAATGGQETALRLPEDACTSIECKDNSSQATHQSRRASGSKPDGSPINPGGHQGPPEAGEQAGADFPPSISDGGAGKSTKGDADISDSDIDISLSERESILSLTKSILSAAASQSTATSIGQLPREARKQAEDVIARVLAESPGVSTIVAKGVAKLGQHRVKWLMAKTLRQFSSATKSLLDKDEPLLTDSFSFIERRATSIACKIRDLAQSESPAVLDNTEIKKYLEDMHSHKVLFSERFGSWKALGPGGCSRGTYRLGRTLETK